MSALGSFQAMQMQAATDPPDWDEDDEELEPALQPGDERDDEPCGRMA